MQYKYEFYNEQKKVKDNAKQMKTKHHLVGQSNEWNGDEC